MKWFFGILGVLGLGFLLGRATLSTPQIVPDDKNAEVEALRQRISELESEVAKRTTPTAAQAVTPSPSPEFFPASPTPLVAEQGKEPERVQESAPKKWRSLEKTLPSIRTQADVSSFLERTRIEDFLSEVQSIRPITQTEEILEYLNGTFTGSMASKGEIPGFDIFLQANLHVRNQVLRGRVSMRLSRNGRTFSRGTSNGDIQTVQRFGEKSAAIIILSDKFYFQLYHIPQLESFEGNCYEQHKPGSMRFVGTVHLERAG